MGIIISVPKLTISLDMQPPSIYPLPPNLPMIRVLNGKSRLWMTLVSAACVYRRAPRCIWMEMNGIELGWMLLHITCALHSATRNQVGRILMASKYILKDTLLLSLLTPIMILGQRL